MARGASEGGGGAGERTALLEDGVVIDKEHPTVTVTKTAYGEARAILALAAPIFIAVSSYIGMKITDTAILGHVGTEYLAASSESDLFTTSTVFLISGRVLTTFCGQAWGAGNKELVGIWMQVSLVVLFVLSIPVIISWNFVEPTLARLGVDDTTAEHAGFYASVLSTSIPAQILFNQGSQYFQAQNLVTPTVVVTCVALVLNIVLNVFVVLGTGFKDWDGLGFRACPAVTTFSTYVQAVLFFGIYFACLGKHKDTWPGWDLSHITKDRIKKFLHLYLPAMLQFASEFWRFNLVGGLAAHLGKTDLAAFNSSYKVIYLVHQFGISVGIATNIRVGTLLGASESAGARRASWIGLALASGIAGALAILVFFIPDVVARIFTNDPAVLRLFHKIAPWLASTIFLMSAADTLQQILVAQARAKLLAIVTFLGSWVVAVPACFSLVLLWRDDLVALYLGVAIGYAGLLLMLMALMASSDWEAITKDAQKRSEVDDDKEAGAGGSGDAHDGDGDGDDDAMLVPEKGEKGPGLSARPDEGQINS